MLETSESPLKQVEEWWFIQFIHTLYTKSVRGETGEWEGGGGEVNGLTVCICTSQQWWQGGGGD